MSTAHHSILKKAAVLAGLTVLLMIPIGLIEGVVKERQRKVDYATHDVIEQSGIEQTLTVPTLVAMVTHTLNTGMEVTERITLIPSQLSIDGNLKVEEIKSGRSVIPIAGGAFTLRGKFPRLDQVVEQMHGSPLIIRPPSAVVTLGVSEPHLIRQIPTLAIGEVAREMESSGPPNEAMGGSRIHGALKEGEFATDREVSFVMSINLGVGRNVWFRGLEKGHDVHLSSPWSSPKFVGSPLPLERKVDEEGFDVTWSIPFMGSSKSLALQNPVEKISNSQFGVTLLPPVDGYRMTHRALYYGVLFLSLTFTGFFVCELVLKLKLHPIQYVMVGAAICLFYLLLVSLSEHLSFSLSYLIAAATICSIITGYSASILKQRSRAGWIAAILTSLYGYLYTVLAAEDISLLLGSIGLTAMLGIIMYLTRNIEWYALDNAPSAELSKPSDAALVG